MSVSSRSSTLSASHLGPSPPPKYLATASFYECKEPQQPTIDQDSDFWETYVEEARKFDTELLDRWNETLSSLLLFAALFSAINTAFIIESQKRLEPDPLQTTNNLLLLLVKHRNDSLELSSDDLNPPWKVESSALRLNAIFFASLSSSLIASFGAILGKEMLSEYKVSGALNSLSERGQIRQLKFDALRSHGFRVLMHLLPILLQISLALFLVGIIDFLWQLKVSVAMVMFVPVVVGGAAYVFSLFMAIRNPHSPLQTSVSKAARSLLSSLHHFLSPTTKYTCTTPCSLRRFSNRCSNSVKALLRGEFRMVPFHWSGLVSGFRRIGDYMDQVARSFLHRKEMEKGDEVKAACVSWLMEEAGDSKVQLRALEAVPLLPPNILLPYFQRKPILERFTTIYNSNLSRRPGQNKFKPGKEQTQAAIVAGMALYHISKARDEGEISQRGRLILGGDSDLFDIVENRDRFSEIDLLLITVIHCVQSQVEVDEWDLKLLDDLLNVCATSVAPSLKPDDSASTLHQGTSSDVSLAISDDTSVVALLLDSILYCASRRCGDDPKRSNLSKYSHSFEEMIHFLPNILEKFPSIMLASHAAIIVSGLQWYKAADEARPRDLKKFTFNGITRERLRSAWFAVDKSAQFHDNVAMVFRMAGHDISPATMDFYLTLMKIVERHHPESMSVTRKDNQAWRKWWGTMVQIFPGLLRVFLKVDEPNRLETAEMVLRIIAQVIPDDWMEGTALQQRGVISQLRHISPHDSESRVGITSLIGTFLDAPDPYGCKTTREAAAEVLGWIMTMEEHLPNAGLPKSIADPTGIYQRSTSIPSFLSVVVTDTSVDEILRLFLQRRFDFLLNLPHPQDGSISATQLEAFIISLTHLHEFPHFRNPCDILEEPPQTVKCIRGFMDRITNGSSESLWPHSFIAAGIIESRPYGTRPYQTVQTLIADDDMLLEDDDRRFLWMGSAITIAWKRFVKTTNVSTNHLSAIFSNDAISMVLLSYDTALKTNISVDFRLLDDYLDAAQRAQKVGKQLQQRVEDARVSLTLVLLGSR